MTLKLIDLEHFIADIKAEGFLEEISNNELELRIARRFGISDYIMNNIKRQLVRFKFIKNKNTNVWSL